MGANEAFVRAHPDLFPRLTPAAIEAGASQFLQGDWPAECLSLLTRFSAPHGNLWSPDTCCEAVQGRGCAVHFFFEHEEPQEGRIHTCVFVERTCAAHGHLPPGHGEVRDSNAGYDPSAHTVWHAVHEENHRKNLAEALALEHLEAHTTRSRDGAPGWSEGISFVWEFDARRHLTVAVTGEPAAPPHADRLDAALTERFDDRVLFVRGG